MVGNLGKFQNSGQSQDHLMLPRNEQYGNKTAADNGNHAIIGNGLTTKPTLVGCSPKNSSLSLVNENKFQEGKTMDSRNPDSTSLVGPTLLAGRKIGGTEKASKDATPSAGQSKKDVTVSAHG